jgi:translocation and assembly module TamB
LYGAQRWAFWSQVRPQSDGRPIHIDRLVWNDDGQQIALDDTTVHWSPAWLLLATASFHDVHVNAATVTIVDNGERRPSPSIPQSLRIPLRLRFHDTVVDRFVLVRNGKSDESSQLRFDVAAGWRTWSMSLARITTPWGDMRGDLAVAAAPPFAVKGGLQVKRAGDRPLTLDVSADGVLDRIEIKAALRAQSSAADASLLYTPFAERPVERAEAALTAVDLRHLMNDAPEAVLDGALHAAATAGRLQGTVTMRNRVPGTIDGGRLPFTSLAADIGAESDAWTLAAMEVDLGSAGKLSGSGRVTADRAAISVRGENINARLPHQPRWHDYRGRRDLASCARRSWRRMGRGERSRRLRSGAAVRVEGQALAFRSGAARPFPSRTTQRSCQRVG